MKLIHLSSKNLACYLSPQASYCLFLVIDGTRADFQLIPNEAFIPPAKLALLQQLNQLGVEITFVTGRNFREARRMISPLTLPIAATHDLELCMGSSLNAKSSDKVELLIGEDFSALRAIVQRITEQARVDAHLWVEYEPYSCALYYRSNPALAALVTSIMTRAIDPFVKEWELKQVRFVLEALPKGINKGYAFLHILNHRRDSTNVSNDRGIIFIGDDVTDESSFAAIQTDLDCLVETQQPYHSLAIKVGDKPAFAKYYVNYMQEM